MTKEDWTLVTDRSQKKRIQNRVAQRTYRNRIKQRVEELEKEVNEYRRREQEAEGHKDGEAGGGGNIATQSAAGEGRTSTGRDRDNSDNHSNATSTRTSRNQSTGKHDDDKSNDKSGSSDGSYVLDMEMTDRDSRPNGDMGAMLQHGNPVMQPQCLTQSTHPRSQMPPQVAFAPFPGFASPPISQPYSLSPDWAWSSVANNMYRDTMNHQGLAEFDHDSNISREQRNSRHSELPILLSKLRENATSWSQWEAHGYQYEIIKSAETIARAERVECISSRAACADVLAEVDKLPANTSGLDSASLSKAFRPLTKLFQDKVPKLWALTESLVGSDESANQRQRCYTSLAIMLLLCCSDQVRKPQMTSLIDSCLEIAYGSMT
ncbi:D-amino-acid oxidase [Purpureocillium lavendulum]|uniref:D-amino-acid oxidase n=1 Tax=Purpureocillium lavendulum TaxID=1247861 RepID=A0AB34FTU5_9HYPO|nr:D-amino-acid oxidase [Purpureocillium lavendulum]